MSTKIVSLKRFRVTRTSTLSIKRIFLRKFLIDKIVFNVLFKEFFQYQITQCRLIWSKMSADLLKKAFYPKFNNCKFNWQINSVTSFTNTPCLHAQVLRGEAYDVWTIINLRRSILSRWSRSWSVATGVWSGHFLVRHLWIRIKSNIAGLFM